MTEQTREKPQDPTSFGLFYPVGYLVVGLRVEKTHYACSRI